MTGLARIEREGEYLFSTSSLDGSRLWVDGVLVVRNGGPFSPGTVEGTVHLSEGFHTVRVDWFELQEGTTMLVEYAGPDTGGAFALVQGFHFPVDVNCSSLTSGTCAAPESGELALLHPGFKASFIHDATLDGVAINYEDEYWGTVAVTKGLNVSFEGLFPVIDLGSEGELTEQFPGYARSFMVGVWEGVFEIQEGGEYTFSTRSDDGSHLWVDGAKVVDNGGRHGPQTRSGKVDLAAGFHFLRADYFEFTGGGGVMQVRYRGADTADVDMFVKGMHINTSATFSNSSREVRLASGLPAVFVKATTLHISEVEDTVDLFGFATVQKGLAVSATRVLEEIQIEKEPLCFACPPGTYTGGNASSVGVPCGVGTYSGVVAATGSAPPPSPAGE